jgi:hypothetical protein
VKIFVSYTSKDREWAHWIGWHLQEAGHEPFVHEWEIQAGGNIPQLMEEKLAAADRLLGVFSDDYCSALYSRSERWAAYWHDADGKKGFLVPIEIRQVREWPIFVKPLKRLSLAGLSEEEAKRRLLEFLDPPRRPVGPPKFPGESRLVLTGTNVQGGLPSAESNNRLFVDTGEPLGADAPSFPPRSSDSNGSWRPADINFSNYDEVRRWVSNKPHEVAAVFAARAALRVAPLLAYALGPRGGGAARIGKDIILPAFRAIATPWVAGQYPTHGVEAAARAAAAGDPAASLTRIGLDVPADEALAAAYAAAAAYADAPLAADAVGKAAEAVCYAVGHAMDDAPRAAAQAAAAAAARADGQIIDDGASASVLAARPLWLTIPIWARDPWQRLRQALLKDHQDWRVWTDWYHARLEGRPVNEALEVARVLIADEIWKQGPRAVNAEIARLINVVVEQKQAATGPDFSDRNAVERWLRGRPREIVVTLAARAALRIAPLLTEALKTPDGALAVLSAFRSMAAAWVVGQYPAHSTKLSHAAASAASASFALDVVEPRASLVVSASVSVASTGVGATMRSTPPTPRSLISPMQLSSLTEMQWQTLPPPSPLMLNSSIKTETPRRSGVVLYG